MSEQQNEPSPKQAEPAKLDSTSAAAALALAVTSAEQSGAKPAETVCAEQPGAKPAETECAEPNAGPLKTLLPSPVEWRTHGMWAAALVVAVGLGLAGGSLALAGGKQTPPATPDWIEAVSSGTRQNQEDLVRLSGDVRVLKNVVEAMKESFDHAKDEAAGRQRALMERVERIERAAQETTATIAHVLEASGRIERASTDADAKLVALSGRFDDIERQSKTAAVKPAATSADGPAQTGSVPEPKAAKDRFLDGWVLRDVYAGVALVESRNGRLHEVVRGMRLPNLGRVEAIERRGRTWVVVTSKGIIGVPERWQ